MKNTDTNTVLDLMMQGPVMPHPKASRKEIYEHCSKMYKQLESCKRWMIEYMINFVEEDEKKRKRAAYGG